MDYRSKVFHWLACKDKIFLLNGPSVASVGAVIDKFKTSQPAIFGINHIFNLERELTKPAGISIHVWVLFSADEVERYAMQIIAFISRDDTIAVLTTTYAYQKIKYIIDFNAKRHAYKIVFCDAVVDNAYRVTDLDFSDAGRYSSQIAINSLGLSLIALSTVPADPSTKVVLFGCDGADSSETKMVYFQQDRMDLGKRNPSERNIYQDMVAIEAAWNILETHLIVDKGLPRLRILNANPDSHFQIFEKIDPRSVDLEGAHDPFDHAVDEEDGVVTENAFRNEMEAHSAMLLRSLARLERTVSSAAAAGPEGEATGLDGQGHTRSEADARVDAARAAVDVATLRLREVQEILVERTQLLEQTAADLVDRTRRLEAALGDIEERDATIVDLSKKLKDLSHVHDQESGAQAQGSATRHIED
ncbi:MAG: hypothetical protein H7Y08_02085 [Rhizobiaceae bacterium]|nr:hypothetical protein [Rhizobiaceae bacterium]